MNRPIVPALVAGVLAALLSANPASRALAAPSDPSTNNDFTHFEEGQGSRGSEVFKGHCAMCHANGVGNAPPVTILGLMPPGSILNALSNGAMRAQGSSLSQDEKIAVSELLAGKKVSAAEEDHAPMCKGRAAAFDYNEPPPFPGWGLTDANTRAIPTGLGGLNSGNIGKLKLKWAFAFPDAQRARSHPALAGGAIFVGSHMGDVYSLDRETGCVRCGSMREPRRAPAWWSRAGRRAIARQSRWFISATWSATFTG